MANLASEVRVSEETSTARQIDASALLVCGGAGICERGPIGVSQQSQDFAGWQKIFGGPTVDNSDTYTAVQAFFDNGGTDLRWTRIVHCTAAGDPTTKTSVAGTLMLQTASGTATPGQATSAVQPFNLANNQTLIVAIDGGGNQTFTFVATAASRTSGNSAPFGLANNDTLIVAIDGGSPLTKTFLSSEFVSIGAATAAEVAASLNAFFASQGAGAVASVSGSAVKITSNRLGTGSGVNVSGGTANAIGKLNFTTGNVAGTGDASDITKTTAAEVVTKLSTLTGALAAVVAGAVQITSSTTGTSSSVQVQSGSTATGLGFDNAVHGGSSGVATNTLQVVGKTDGAYASGVTTQIAAATDGNASEFNLYVLVNGVVKERYFNASMTTTATNYIGTMVNDAVTGSDLIQVVTQNAFGVNAGALVQRPNNGTFGPLTGGNNGLSGLTDADFTGGESANGTTGLRCLDGDDIDVLIVPGRATSAVHNGMVTYCEIVRAGLCFAILDPPKNQTAAQIVSYVTTTANLSELSDKCAIYWPNVLVSNPSTAVYGNGPTVVAPPSGAVAGIYARNDARKVGGVFEQPAGTDFGIPRNVIGLEMPEVKKKAKRDLVFPKLINPISQEKGTPIFVDGARTLKSGSPWPSVGQRRGVIFVEKRLIPGLAFMRHRNIKPRLYSEGERAVKLFLLELTRNDAFRSTDPSKAFFIDFGTGLNPPSVQFQHQVVARIGLATSFPAEFIQLLITPDTRELEAELAALAAV
jgi:uncharacterized protein